MARRDEAPAAGRPGEGGQPLPPEIPKSWGSSRPGAPGASAPPPAPERPCQTPTSCAPAPGSLGGSPPQRPAVRTLGAEGGGSRLLPAWKLKHSILLSEENKVQIKLFGEALH